MHVLLCHVWWIKFQFISRTQKICSIHFVKLLKSQFTKDYKVFKPSKINFVLNLSLHHWFVPSLFFREEGTNPTFERVELCFRKGRVLASWSKSSRNKWKHSSEVMFLREEMESSSQITCLVLIIPAHCG